MTTTIEQYKSMLPYATEREAEFVKALEAHGTYRSASKNLNIKMSSFTRALSRLRGRAAKKDTIHHLGEVVPQGLEIKGVSAYHQAKDRAPCIRGKDNERPSPASQSHAGSRGSHDG